MVVRRGARAIVGSPYRLRETHRSSFVTFVSRSGRETRRLFVRAALPGLGRALGRAARRLAAGRLGRPRPLRERRDRLGHRRAGRERRAAAVVRDARAGRPRAACTSRPVFVTSTWSAAAAEDEAEAEPRRAAPAGGARTSACRRGRACRRSRRPPPIHAPASDAMCTPSRVLCSRSCRSISAASAK